MAKVIYRIYAESMDLPTIGTRLTAGESAYVSFNSVKSKWIIDYSNLKAAEDGYKLLKRTWGSSLRGIYQVIVNNGKEEEALIQAKGLVEKIPEEGSYEWAVYVSENYSTDYFKPVDLFRAGKIVERQKWKNALSELSEKIS